MNIILKVVKTVYGFLLVLLYRRTFDLNLLKGKRIAIIGAANTALGTGLGSYIDEFDIIVRINKAPLLVASQKFKEDIGTRTDILFHSFFENEFSGGGALDFDLYDRLQIKYVINPLPGIYGFRLTLNFYKKYLERRIVYQLPSGIYHFVKDKFSPFRPTTGFYALLTVLRCDFKELYITGFTFFQTAYIDGYRDSLKEVDVNKKYIAESKQHDPEIEFREFKHLLNENRHKSIHVDSQLELILQRKEL